MIKCQQHNHKYFSGKDATVFVKGPLERYCTICGMIELYSGLIKQWIRVGNINDKFPEEQDAGRLIDPYDH